jgi:3-oxoacyl-[acyl-carrier protein] reductase
MMTSLAGDVALVTGASGGIGGATALALAKAGAAVGVHFNRDQAGAEKIADAVRGGGGRAVVVQGDVVDPASVEAIVAETVRQLGPINILVNNSGTLQNLPFGSITPSNFHEQFSANVLGAVLMTQAAARHFPAKGARVVNVSTNLVYGPLPGTALYAAAKAAIIILTQGFARELGSRGVNVNAVAPGATDTPMLSWLTDDMRTGIADSTPLGRMGLPGDVADVIVFLASPAARWVNGRTIIVDGGLM